MRFVIDQSLAKICPSHLSVALVRIQLSPQCKADLSVLNKLKAKALQSLLDQVPSGMPAELETIDSIAQWMQTYKAMGVKPKRIKPTHYGLSLRLVKQKEWPRSIGPLVDIYLTNQIQHLMPHGGYDVTKLSCDTIQLTLCNTERQFQPLGVSTDDEAGMETTKVGEVLYLDMSESSTFTLCRYFNHRDAEPTKIVDAEKEAESTKDFVLLVESVDGSEAGRAKLKQTAEDLEHAYRKVYGDGVMQSYVRIVDLVKGDEKASTLDLDW